MFSRMQGPSPLRLLPAYPEQTLNIQDGSVRVNIATITLTYKQNARFVHEGKVDVLACCLSPCIHAACKTFLLIWQEPKLLLESASLWGSHSRLELTGYGTCAGEGS